MPSCAHSPNPVAKLSPDTGAGVRCQSTSLRPRGLPLGTYNTCHTNLECPRCGYRGIAEVDMYLGHTAQMLPLNLGDHYPGVPGPGPNIGEGYAECSSCDRDYHCRVSVEDGILTRIVPDTTRAPYIPSSVRSAERPCPGCNEQTLVIHEFGGMVGHRAICQRSGCSWVEESMPRSIP